LIAEGDDPGVRILPVFNRMKIGNTPGPDDPDAERFFGHRSATSI
jgi:hypothetical protein